MFDGLKFKIYSCKLICWVMWVKGTLMKSITKTWALIKWTWNALWPLYVIYWLHYDQ